MSTLNKSKALSKKSLRKTWWTWVCWGQICYNYERMMGLGFCHTMTTAIDELYENEEDKKEALVRHMAYYNTENTWGALIPGICCSLEEEKSNGAAVDGETISNLKTALMGPIAGIGDTVTKSLVKVILLGICIDMSLAGNAFGPILFVLGFSAYALIVSYLCFFQGYKFGKKSVVKILSGGMVKNVTESLGVIGMIVLGALIAKNIGVVTPLVWNFGAMTINLQGIFDSILPNLIPVAIFAGTYYFINKGKKATTVMFYIMISAVVLSLLGILA